MKVKVLQHPARQGLALAGALALAAAVAGCGGNSTGSTPGEYGFPQAKQDPNSEITVWVDATREPAVEAFEKANPSVKVKTVIYEASSEAFRTKINLLDRAGEGWPDVVFSAQTQDTAWASQKSGTTQAFAARLDQGLVPSSTISDFTPGALDVCSSEGAVYCLRNDLAPNLLWYDKTLMDKFGYDVPTTWEEYQELGENVATEHPGYIVGSVGDNWAPYIFFWASQCEANNITGPRSVTVNTDTEECKRAASLVDSLVAAGSLTNLSVFTPEFVQKYSGKVLMMPGPAWYTGAIFGNKENLNAAPGSIGAAPPLSWGDAEPVTGNVGGATWFISSHSTNLEAASQFVQWVTTDDDYQVELAPGYPAYAPAATKWLAKQESSDFFATDLSAITTAASAVWPGWGSGLFDQQAVWGKVMAPLLTAGEPIEPALAEWGQAIEDQAKAVGYTVQ